MQHSTHNHTPTHHNHHHTHPRTHDTERDALDGPGQEQPETTPTRVSPQDPTVCQTPQNKIPGNIREPELASHPATPTTNTTAGMFIKEKENPTSPTQQPGRLLEGHPHQHDGLLRKEVIQPHLPVRLPCYDFVPIASPTFDDSLPKG
jgi:hypothetical protein